MQKMNVSSVMKIIDELKRKYPIFFSICFFVGTVLAEQLVLNIVNKLSGLKGAYYLNLFITDSKFDINILSQQAGDMNQHPILSLDMYIVFSVIFIACLLFLAIDQYRRIVDKTDRESELGVLSAKIKELEDDRNDKETEITVLKPLADAQRIVISNKRLIEVLSEYVKSTEVVKCIQLYNIDENIGDDTVVVSFSFVDGFSDNNVNVNALFRMNYHFDRTIYDTFWKLIADVDGYYKAVKKPSNKVREDNIQVRIKDLFALVAQQLNTLNSESEILDAHYAYYRILEILTTMVVGSDTLVECKQLLKYSTSIEKQLRTGQRTGMLGTYFLNKTYYFGNDNSFVKRDRGYFASPMKVKESKLIMLVVLSRKSLKMAAGEKEVDACKRIHKEIKELLLTRFSDERSVT